MMAEEPKSDLKNAIGIYLGRVLDNQKDDWKKYKAQFEIEGKAWNFSLFTPWTKKDGTAKKGVDPKDLEEGNWYRLGYTEFLSPENEAKGFSPSKTLVAIFDATKPSSPTQSIS